MNLFLKKSGILDGIQYEISVIESVNCRYSDTKVHSWFVLKMLNKSGGGCLGSLQDMLLHNIGSNLGQKTKSFIEPFFLNLDFSISHVKLHLRNLVVFGFFAFTCMP